MKINQINEEREQLLWQNFLYRGESVDRPINFSYEKNDHNVRLDHFGFFLYGIIPLSMGESARHRRFLPCRVQPFPAFRRPDGTRQRENVVGVLVPYRLRNEIFLASYLHLCRKASSLSKNAACPAKMQTEK
jgi:hypothetical protein